MFDTLVGNEHFKKSVLKMIESNRLVHSIILEGADGIGKHTAASIIAAAAICEEENAPCGRCRMCINAGKLKHADISMFAPEKSTFKIETVRDKIRVEAYIKPFEAKRKVFILEHTELMTKDAQNAMLKILEEPPESLIFILLVTHASKLLPTIRSRCLTISLREPSLEDAVNYLKANTDFSPDEITSALKETECNIGKAKELLSDSDNALAKTVAREIYNSLDLGELEMLKIFHSEIGSKRDFAINVLNELEYLVIKNIKLGATDNSALKPVDTLVKILPHINYTQKCLTSNCNVQLAFTVLAEELFCMM